MDQDRKALVDYLLAPKPPAQFDYSTDRDPYYETDADRQRRQEARQANYDVLQSMALTATGPASDTKRCNWPGIRANA